MTQPYGPMSAQPQPQPVPPKKSNAGRIVLIVLGVIFVLCIGGMTVAAIVGSGQQTAIRDTTVPAVTESEEDAPVTEEETTKPKPQPAEEEEQLTVSQEQAVGSAQDYLSFMGFSRSGLIKQLQFEGFSEKDAEFAVDYIEVDWKEQAVIVAESYLDSQHFSRQGLIDQLEFEGFTTKQAEHGANEVGL